MTVRHPMLLVRRASLLIALSWAPVGGARAQAAPDPAAAPDPVVAPEAPVAAPAPVEPSPATMPTEPPGQGYPTQAPTFYAPSHPPGAQYGGDPAPWGGRPNPRYQAMQGRLPGPGSHEHEGFYLHLGTGIGAGAASYRERVDGSGVSNVRTRGIAITFDVGVGGRVADNFIVHGDATFTFFDARKRVDGVEDNGYDGIDSTLWMLGAGGTYYFMPTNIYLTVVVGTGGFIESRDYRTFGLDEVQIESGAGFAGSLSLGKEWWVGGRGEWAIGGAVKTQLMSAPLEIANYDTTLFARAVTLEFSATLN